MEVLTTSDNYTTPSVKIRWWRKIFPSVCFFWQMGAIVLRSAKLAKQGTYNSERWAASSFDVFHALESVGIKFDVENLDVVRNLSAPVVLIGNHMSTLETFVLPCLTQPYFEVTFLVKQSLIKKPIFKHVMISRDPVVVGRENPRDDLKQVLEGGNARLEKNISIIIFPQTPDHSQGMRTRSVEFVPENFNSIGIKLAKRAGVKVVPIALKTDAWGSGKKFKDIGKIDPTKTVHISFGKPLEITGTGKDQHQEVIEFIQQKLGEWKMRHKQD